MILGIDHLALSSSEVRARLADVQDVGYRVKFVHGELPNSITKKPFLSAYHPLHDVAYCENPQGIALELTAHGGPLEEVASSYQVLLRRPPADRGPFTGPLPCAADIWRTVLGCEGAQAATWRPFLAQFWYVPGSVAQAGDQEDAATVRALLVPASDLERSCRFWTEGLRAREFARGTARDRRWVHVAWPSPIPRWSLDIILLETPERRGRSYLDGAGFSCLALLSTDVAHDRLRLIELGAEDVSEASEHVVNGRSIRIAIARGPSQELVELIEITQPSGRRDERSR